MSIETQNQKYQNWLKNIIANGFSAPILTADFKTIKVSIQTGLILVLTSIVGTFQIGEEVTGGTSAATGIVAFDAGSGTFYLQSVVGTFTAAEEVTGGTSGATGTVDSADVPNFELVVFGSYNNNYTEPNMALPIGPDNEYHPLGYTDESSEVQYAAAMPYNPNTVPDGTIDKGFNIDTTGINWIFVGIQGYVSGALNFCNVNLFSNYN